MTAMDNASKNAGNLISIIIISWFFSSLKNIHNLCILFSWNDWQADFDIQSY
jgi:hypothetical protein